MGKMSKEEMLAYVRTYVATMGNEAGWPSLRCWRA